MWCLMDFFFRLFEPAAVFVPNFLTLGMVTLAFFSLFCIVETLDVAASINTDSALEASLALAYLATMTINIVGSLRVPVRSAMTASSPLESGAEHARRDSLSGTRNARAAGRESAVGEP